MTNKSRVRRADVAVGDTVGVKGTVTGTSVVATAVMDGLMPHMGKGGFMGKMGMGKKHAPLGQDGNVTAINGNTITMQEESDEGGASYTVDAGSATVTKDGAASNLAAIKVGDKIFVKGTVTGGNVTATAIADGHGHGGWNHKGPKTK